MWFRIFRQTHIVGITPISGCSSVDHTELLQSWRISINLQLTIWETLGDLPLWSISTSSCASGPQLPLLLQRKNTYWCYREWMGMGVAAMIIHNYYGSFPHSLHLAPVRIVKLRCFKGLLRVTSQGEFPWAKAPYPWRWPDLKAPACRPWTHPWLIHLCLLAKNKWAREVIQQKNLRTTKDIYQSLSIT